MVNKYFGTDGIRGQVGVAPMIPEFLVKLGWAIGTVLAQHNASRVAIGKDTRITGALFESALQAGFTAAGVDVYMLGTLPTPGIAYLTRSMGFDAGIVISASHNPYQDNGVKIFSRDGTKISDEIEQCIEHLLAQPMVMVASEKIGHIYRVDEAIKRYLDFCQQTFPANLSLKNLKIIVDCANGANYYIGPRILSDLGAEVMALGDRPDGLNINLDCGSTHPELLQKTVLSQQADLGIAFDGDGDRLIMVDHKGELVDGDELLFIIVNAAKNTGKSIGGVAGTLMTNLGLEEALQNMDIPMVRTKVGDRYVLEALKQHNWEIGGEASGHIIHLGYSTTGDGIIASLLVLAEIARTGKPLHELKQAMHKCPQSLINVKILTPVDPLSVPAIKAATEQVEKQLQGRGRVLLRASGTEPLIRVMVEGHDAAEVAKLATELAHIVEKALT